MSRQNELNCSRVLVLTPTQPSRSRFDRGELDAAGRTLGRRPPVQRVVQVGEVAAGDVGDLAERDVDQLAETVLLLAPTGSERTYCAEGARDPLRDTSPHLHRRTVERAADGEGARIGLQGELGGRTSFVGPAQSVGGDAHNNEFGVLFGQAVGSPKGPALPSTIAMSAPPISSGLTEVTER